MNSDNLPTPENEQYDPNLEAQDEEVASGGNNRLVYILGAFILALVVGYIALPKGNGSNRGLSSVTPSFMLDDAAVTGTTPTPTDSVANSPKAVSDAETKPAEAPKPVVKPAATASTTASTTASASSAAAAPTAPREPARVAVAAPEPGPTATAAEPTQDPAPAAPEPAATGTVTTSGRIEDENGRPLVGATVLLKGSSKGTSTDANGFYTLDVPNGTDNTLIFGYGGYNDEEVRNRSNQPVNIALTPRAKTSKKRR